MYEDIPSEVPPIPSAGDAVVVQLGPHVGTRRGTLLEPDNKCEGGFVPVQLDRPLVGNRMVKLHPQGDDLHMLSIIVREMSERGYSDDVGIGADTHVQLCFQEAYADDVCGPQYKRQKERIMGRRLPKQVRPNKHRLGTIHRSCGQILDKMADPIPGRPGKYYLPDLGPGNTGGCTSYVLLFMKHSK
jgi:hypothetical protein